jgi:hypothetical protein
MSTIDINSMTLGQIKEISALVNVTPQMHADNSAWEVGSIYLIRTVTMTDTGRLVAVTQQELVLEDAAWIADTGRFSDAVEKAEFGEVEPFPNGRVILGRGAIVDAVKIKSAPRGKK